MTLYGEGLFDDLRSLYFQQASGAKTVLDAIKAERARLNKAALATAPDGEAHRRFTGEDHARGIWSEDDLDLDGNGER